MVPKFQILALSLRLLLSYSFGLGFFPILETNLGLFSIVETNKNCHWKNVMKKEFQGTSLHPYVQIYSICSIKMLACAENTEDRYRKKIQKKVNAAMPLKFGSSVLNLRVPSWPDRLKHNFLKKQENSFLSLFVSLATPLFLP